LPLNFNEKSQERQDKQESIDEQLLRQQAEGEKQRLEELNNDSEVGVSENDDGKNDDGDDNGNGKGGRISGNSGEGAGNGKGARLPVAERLVELVTRNSNAFFKDQYDTPYARIHSVDHYEIVKVESNKFKRHLIGLYFEKENKVANAEAVNNAVQVLQARAEYRGDTVPMTIRVAWHNGDIYYDLTNARWQSVKITNESWSIIDETPTPLFMRYNQVAQVQPSRHYQPDVFDGFMQLTNLKREEDRFLLKVYIISLFIPGIHLAWLCLLTIS
jgi:hypothetical protein